MPGIRLGAGIVVREKNLMMYRSLIPILMGAPLMLWQCSPAPAPRETAAAAVPTAWTTGDSIPKLGSYWHQGKAEISRFELQQHRYRDLHPGEAVLVMVTEDFLTDKQVKNDRYENPNTVPVLKTNLITRFSTGIYDYSIMTSVFTPDGVPAFPHTLKVTHSSQDWCGQTFMQLNHAGKSYRTQVRSYFEGEADEDGAVPLVLLEDELFNRIRMNPKGLPTGKINILPSATIVRLLHRELQPLDAEAGLLPYTGDAFPGEQLLAYRVVFPALKRTLEIVFEQAPPYRIAGWSDSYPGFDGKERRTVARRTHLVLDDYWKHNSAGDASMRKALGLGN